MSGDLHPMRIKCQHCGTMQRIVADDLPADASLHCTNCRALLGHWADLRAATPPGRTV